MGQHHFGAGKVPVPVQKITDEITETGQAVSGSCVFNGVMIKTNGTNDVTISVYSGISNAGDKLIPASTIIPGSSRLSSIEADPGISCPNGIYIEMSGTGAVCQVLYDN